MLQISDDTQKSRASRTLGDGDDDDDDDDDEQLGEEGEEAWAWEEDGATEASQVEHEGEGVNEREGEASRARLEGRGAILPMFNSQHVPLSQQKTKSGRPFVPGISSPAGLTDVSAGRKSIATTLDRIGDAYMMSAQGVSSNQGAQQMQQMMQLMQMQMMQNMMGGGERAVGGSGTGGPMQRVESKLEVLSSGISDLVSILKDEFGKRKRDDQGNDVSEN